MDSPMDKIQEVGNGALASRGSALLSNRSRPAASSGGTTREVTALAHRPAAGSTIVPAVESPRLHHRIRAG